MLWVVPPAHHPQVLQLPICQLDWQRDFMQLCLQGPELKAQRGHAASRHHALGAAHKLEHLQAARQPDD